MPRFQMDLSTEMLNELKGLKEETGLASKRELINYAITVFKWAIQEVKKGNVIASVNEEGKKYSVLETPPFLEVRTKVVDIALAKNNLYAANPPDEEVSANTVEFTAETEYRPKRPPQKS